MKTIKKIESEPRYHTYFEQDFSEGRSWVVELFNGVSMEWIADLQAEQDKEKADYAAINGTISGPSVYSHDPLSDDFPCFHDWPVDIQSEFNKAANRQNEQRREMAYTGQRVTCGHVTLYLECQDGAHYFSTPHFDHGGIYKAAASDASDVEFDSVETAVYAFYNDWSDWNGQYGEAKRRQDKLLVLEAMRLDSSNHDPAVDVGANGCQHEDLGSLGYQHGAVVDCPFCGERAEVW